MATDQGSAPENGAAKQNGTAPTHEVGWMFVHEYYTFLNKSPQKLHFFYNKDSSFVHGTVGDQVEAIQEKIASLEFEDCKVLVSNVDSLASIGNSIIIQVLGEMSNKGLPSQRFAQTFVLAEQPNGYYVLNDVFRYLKEDDDEEEVEVAHADAQDLEHAVETLHINQTEETSHTNAVDHSQLNGQAEVAAEETKEAVVPQEEPKSTETNGVVEEPVQTVSESEVAQAKAPAVKEEKEKAAAPKTWANLAANNQSKWGSQVSEAKGQVVSMAPGAAQAPAQTGKAHQAKSSDSKSKEHKRHKQDEAVSAYVRNVTPEMTEQAIREAMSVIGPIRSVDVNCAFVEFTNEKDFKAAVAQGTFEIGTHGAVIAEERRRQTPHNRDGRNRFERPQGEKRSNGFQRDAKRGKANGEQPKKKANDKK
ncbi:hypothetical protein BZG36_04100 [Bifiguratus adelaidae]|uniref:NTF2 domain-containing protein n=1 Tax=Bifiguratus adelaidae TaxID=1938954 RepID=A0A261XVQ6_9FUNG|nr:hypothetical protein BZG36_04100 [Bifiguratus adelaidae]